MAVRWTVAQVIRIGICLVCKRMRRLILVHPFRTTRAALAGSCAECRRELEQEDP